MKFDVTHQYAMSEKVYTSIVEGRKAGKKQFAVLIDPDKTDTARLEKIAAGANKAAVDYFFIGGSLLTNDHLGDCIAAIKEWSDIPVVIFPGNLLQINNKADAIFFLSLISGRNADMLIGKHVIAAPLLKKSKLEVIATGYMLVNSGNTTTVAYMSNTTPIPYEKDDIAMCTAMAGEMLGLKLLYMDAGSGAMQPISENMVQAVSKNTSLPIVVGGGIKTARQATDIARAGADIIVVGNAIEHDSQLIHEISEALQAI